MEIALFPLHTVLFPGGPLCLRIFETRYLGLVSRCLRDDAPFGVCLIRDGQEVGGSATPHRVGTLARIVDWEQRPDGLLGITAVGGQRFRVETTWKAPDGLNVATVTPLPAAAPTPLPEQPTAITALLDRLLALERLGYGHCRRDEHDAEWLAGRLAEALPLETADKQALLEMDDPLSRLQALQPLIPELALPGSARPPSPQ